MEFSLKDNLLKRIKLAVALIASYGLSFFLMEFFFIGSSPMLNPQGFQLVGEKAKKLNLSISAFLKEAGTPNRIPPPITGQTTIFPTYPPQTNPTPTIPMNYPSNPPPIPPTFPPIAPTLPKPLPTLTYLPLPPTSKPYPTTPPPVNTPIPPKTKVTYADFGKCLNDNGMVMYMTTTCGLCSQQKKTLKDAANYIRMVDCNLNEANGLECGQVGVRGLPTWAKNGKAVLAGPQSLETLAQTAGCQAPTQ